MNPETPELQLYTFNSSGEALTFESITVPGMPKGTALEVRLACAPDGLWRTGYAYEAITSGALVPVKITKVPHSSVPQVLNPAFPSRIEALLEGVKLTALYFSESKKATAAIERFYDGLKAASIATVAEVMAPQFAPLPRADVHMVRMDRISANPENHRKIFDSVSILELAESIRSTGLLQPIAVRALTAAEVGELLAIAEASSLLRYEIILGERRWRAHQVLGVDEIEAKVYHGITRKQALAAALVENLQRREVSPIEEAEGYRDLMAAEELTQEQCAKRLGRSRPSVANALRVLDLPAEVLDVMRAGKLTVAHGLALHKWSRWPELVRVIAEQAVHDSTSAGQLESWNREGALPFVSVLRASGLVEFIHKHEIPGGYDAEWPEEFAGDKDYIAQGTYSYICLVPSKWIKLAEKLKSAHYSKLEKLAADKAQGSPIKSLADLERGSYRRLSESEEADLAELLPADKTLKLPDGSATEITVTLVPKFAERVAEAMRDARRADREDRWPIIVEEVLFEVNDWCKLGPRQVATLLAVSLLQNDECSAVLTPHSVALVTGRPMVSALKLDDYENYWGHGRTPQELAPFMTALSQDPVAYAIAFVRDFVTRLFTDSGYTGEASPTAEQWRFNHPITESHRQLLLWILNREELGLLEESAEGRRTLVESVRAQDWYAEAYTQASAAGGDLEEIEDAEAA